MYVIRFLNRRRDRGEGEREGDIIHFSFFLAFFLFFLSFFLFLPPPSSSVFLFLGGGI